MPKATKDKNLDNNIAKKNGIDNYESMQVELNTILEALQSESIALDEALTYYERGLILIQELKKYINTAENKIEILKTEFEE